MIIVMRKTEEEAKGQNKEEDLGIEGEYLWKDLNLLRGRSDD